jgi:hypothetical protein
MAVVILLLPRFRQPILKYFFSIVRGLKGVDGIQT